jgi:hypothetical protein
MIKKNRLLKNKIEKNKQKKTNIILINNSFFYFLCNYINLAQSFSILLIIHFHYMPKISI